MFRNIKHSAAIGNSDANYILAVAHKAIHPEAPPQGANRCRFDLFIRIKPEHPGIYSKKGLQRTWCYRGDKFATEEHQMIRKLLNHLQKKITIYDRVELYDNHKTAEERILLKITDGIIEKNQLHQYQLMLLNYPLPEYLKVNV